jgi:hypothetical protein
MTRYAPPSSEELIAAAERLGMTLSADAATMFARYGAALEFAYRRVDALDEHLPPPDPDTRTFTRPSPDENRLGAWLVKSSIKRGAGGKARRQVHCGEGYNLGSRPAIDRRHRFREPRTGFRRHDRRPHSRRRR